nr:hypothetical protein [Tanacetum cinerariifolium]
ESGSGKSTFATGVAGYLAASGTQVFKHLGGGQNGQAVIEQVMLAANALVKIIVVVTRDQYASEGNVEQHFFGDAQHIDWLGVQPAVQAALLAHEEDVAAYVSLHAAPASRQQLVGSGALDIPLKRLLDQYVRESKTVWQFIYLLGGGIERIEQAYREQRSKDRFDLVILRISLNQLTDFEKATSLNELLNFYQADSAATENSLETVAFLAHYLHLWHLRTRQTLIAEAFQEAAPTMVAAARRSKAEEGTFYLLHKLCLVLEKYCPAVFIELLDGLGPQYFIDRIVQAECDEFDNLSQLLLAAMEIHPTWVLAFPNSVGIETVRQIAQRATHGNLESLFNLIAFQRRFLFNLTKSQLDFYVDCLGKLLTGCSLFHLNYPLLGEQVLVELSLSPLRIQRMLAGLNMTELAREYETAAPRYWGTLLSLSILEERVGLNSLGQFVNLLHPDSLVQNVMKRPLDAHALRLMLYQLYYGSAARRVELASLLRPHVEKVLL